MANPYHPDALSGTYLQNVPFTIQNIAAGQLAADSVPAKLEDMHRFAVCLFRGAVTDELYQAMGPTPLAE